MGWSRILCIEFRSDKKNARIWQLAENFYRGELSVLERAEHIDELRILVQTKSEEGQVAPPGGSQPKEFGIKKTAKALGLTNEEVRRAKAMAAMSPKAKAKVKELGLDDNQRALLEIAAQPTPKAQLRAVNKIVERKRADHERNASPPTGNKKTTADMDAIEADISKKETALESLQSELAADRKRLRQIHDKLAVQDKVALPPRKQSAAAAHAQPGSEVRSEVTLGVDGVAADEVASSAPKPTDEGIPAFLDRRPLSPEDERAFDAIMVVWTSSGLQSMCSNASAVVRERFIAEVRAITASRWAAE